MTDLGKVGINPRKAWVSETIYERLDLVSYKGAAYLALRETTAEPVDDNVNWMLIAEGVDTGGVEDIVDAKIATLSDVAISGAYGDLIGTPSALPADGGNSDTVDGFHASQTNTPDTAVVRDSDGGVQVGRIISDAPDDGNTAVGQIIVTNGADGLYRKVGIEEFKRNIELGDVRTYSIYSQRGVYVNFLAVSGLGETPFIIDCAARGGAMRRYRFVANEMQLRAFNSSPILSYPSNSVYNQGINMIVAKTLEEWNFYIYLIPYGQILFFIRTVSNVKAEFKYELAHSLPEGYVTATEISGIL